MFLLDERVFMHLGILKVAAVLEQAGHKVEMLDLSGIQNYEDVVRLHAKRTQAKVFGITSTTPQLRAVHKIAQILKESGSRVILGGPHVTLVNTAFKAGSRRGAKAMAQLFEMADVLVAGDGEDAIFQAIEPNSPRIVDADDSKSSLFLTDQRFDELPLPARHLIDVDSYHFMIDGRRGLSLIGQLGCPFTCGFCSGRNSPSFRKIRLRSVGNVISEVEHLHAAYGVTGFMFYDDELNVNKALPDLLRGLIKLQSKLGVDFRFRGCVKAELFTEEQARLMHETGFRTLLVGFESGSPRILENINKKATREDNTRCLELAQSHGIGIKALMSIGHPGESPETVEETKQWLIQVKPKEFDVTIITTIPGSHYYDRAVETKPGVWTYTQPKTGDKLHSLEIDYAQVMDYYKGVPGQYQSFVFTDCLSPKDLVILRDDVEASVRAALKIPFNTSAQAVRYEHSMGMLGPTVFRST